MSGTRNHKDSELSHIYKEGGWPEPSRQIDAAILAAARAQHSFLRRWSPPLALAATVVLSFTLLLRMSEEKPNDAPYSLPSPDRQPAAEEPKPAPAEGPVSVPNAAPAAKSGSVRKSTATAKPASTLSSAPVAKSASALRSAPSAKSDALSRPASAPRTAVSAAPTPAPRPAAAPSAPAPATAAPPFAFKKETPEGARADRPALPTESRAAGGRTLESSPANEAQRETPAPSPSAPTRAGEPLVPSPAPAGARPAAGSVAASDIVVRRSESERTPQSWLEDIRGLKTQGRAEEAGRELAEFKKRYPDFALPEDLR